MGLCFHGPEVCIKQPVQSPDDARFIRVYHMSPLNITNSSWITIILSFQKWCFPPQKGTQSKPLRISFGEKDSFISDPPGSTKTICSSQWVSFSSNISEYEIELSYIKKTYLLAAGFPLRLLPNRGLSLKSIIRNLSFMSGGTGIAHTFPPTKPCVFMYRNIDTVPADQHPSLSILTAYPCRSYIVLSKPW